MSPSWRFLRSRRRIHWRSRALFNDRSTPDDGIAIVENGGLAWHDGEHGLLEPDIDAIPLGADTRPHGRRSVSDGYVEVDGKPQAGRENDVFEHRARRAERFA
jgi:hypothetical protein